jgi:hypothetical protein
LRSGWLPEAIARDERTYICTGDAVAKSGRWPSEPDPYLLETSVPGIFACGDVRCSPVKRAAAAVGEGSMSIAFVHLPGAAGGQAMRTRVTVGRHAPFEAVATSGYRLRAARPNQKLEVIHHGNLQRPVDRPRCCPLCGLCLRCRQVGCHGGSAQVR